LSDRARGYATGVKTAPAVEAMSRFVTTIGAPQCILDCSRGSEYATDALEIGLAVLFSAATLFAATTVKGSVADAVHT